MPGAGGFVRAQAAGVIDGELAAEQGGIRYPANGDKYAVARQRAAVAGMHILEPDTGYPLIVQDFRDAAVPQKLHGTVLERTAVYRRGAQVVPTVNKIHLAAQSGQIKRILGCAVAAAGDHHRFILIQHTVAGCAIRYAVPAQAGFLRQPEFPRIGAGGGNHRLGKDIPVGCGETLGLRVQVHRDNLGKTGLRTETFGAFAHAFPERKAVDALVKSRIIVHLPGGGHLSAGRHLFQHQHRQTAARAV